MGHGANDEWGTAPAAEQCKAGKNKKKTPNEPENKGKVKQEKTGHLVINGPAGKRKKRGRGIENGKMPGGKDGKISKSPNRNP